jgi:hypothetical protein
MYGCNLGKTRAWLRSLNAGAPPFAERNADNIASLWRQLGAESQQRYFEEALRGPSLRERYHCSGGLLSID